MKSPMIAANPHLSASQPNVPEAKTSGYTELQVMRSAAGWYVGTYWEERDEDGTLIYQEPGSRDTGYFGSESEAADHLKLMTALGDETAAMVMRQHP